MSAPVKVKVDEKKRVELTGFTQPGEIYRVEAPEPGQIVLRRMMANGQKAQMTFEQALKAVKDSPLQFSGSYDELRKLTREL